MLNRTIDISEILSGLDNSDGRKIFGEFLSAEFDVSLLQTFDALTKLYLEVNSVINISALRTLDDIYLKHYLDSLAPHKYFKNGSICDVGCGGGFPTIPLAITKESIVTGVESVGKKLTLIKRCITELNISNLKYEYSRSEELAKSGKRYKNVCARALADADKAFSYCAPLCTHGSRLILYKSQSDAPPSNTTLKKYDAKLSDTVDYTLFGTDIKRRVYIFDFE